MKRVGLLLAISTVFVLLFSPWVFAKESKNNPFLRIVFEFSFRNDANDNILLFAVADPYVLGSFKDDKTIICGRKKVDNHSYMARVSIQSSEGDTFSFMAGQISESGNGGFTAIQMGIAKFRSGSSDVSSYAFTPVPVELRVGIMADKSMFDFVERVRKEDQKRGKKIEQLECKVILRK